MGPGLGAVKTSEILFTEFSERRAADPRPHRPGPSDASRDLTGVRAGNRGQGVLVAVSPKTR
jgi:hypothetical protein